MGDILLCDPASISALSNAESSTGESPLQLKPFLKWAGGKSQFVGKILEHMPPASAIRNYYEPFLGAGSIYLAYRPKRAFLSDSNARLIDTFIAVRDKPKLVHEYLCQFASQNSESFFYRMRDEFNRSRTSVKQAARFIFLNKAGFNGIYRVNTAGEFNVPYAYRATLAIPSLEHLVATSVALNSAKLSANDYISALSNAGQRDLVYLDPPYPPLNDSSYFTHYTKERFSVRQQYDVAKLAQHLKKKGAFVVITNADTPEIRALYKDWHIHSIERTRWITSSKSKHKVNELVITNYLG